MSNIPNTRSPVLDKVLSLLHNVRRSGDQSMARCPAHEDRNNSLAVRLGDDGRVLLKCHAGCETDAVLSAVNLTMRDLFPQDEGGGGATPSPGTRARLQHPEGAGCTLAAYGQAKRLSLVFLAALGLTEIFLQSSPAVRIPYRNERGDEVAVRFRVGLTDAGGSRFRWKTGDKPVLYGLWRLQEARAAKRVVLVEGESDAQTLWLHGVPAVGLPGAASWREEWAAHFDGLDEVLVFIEKDAGGEAMKKWLAASSIRDRVRLVTLDGHKDPSALHVADPDAFQARWEEALAAAVPWKDASREEAKRESEAAWDLCGTLAQRPRILEDFAESLARRGVAGEARIGKLLYLAVTSRFLDRPVSMAVKGPSSGGKSYLVEQVLSHFPPSAYYTLTAMSERTLAYSQEPLKHRMLVIYEAAGMQSEFGSYLIRSLLSEGRIRYETVQQTDTGLEAKLLEREGPTGLIVTTTAVNLHPENETRLLSVTVTDTPEQTQNIMRALATGKPGKLGDLSDWRALQTWLEHGERRVLVPFALRLAEITPPVVTRLRRDFGALLTLVRAHALLHQATRERDGQGQVVATVEDYAAIHDLVGDLFAQAAHASVSPAIRETVATLCDLVKDGQPVSLRRLAEELLLDRSAASRRVRTALADGYLLNVETNGGRPMRLLPGEPIPAPATMLPHPNRLRETTANREEASR